ncbi:hypothetical protein L6R52_15810 [Myxococcota bacterium]|nr:hypothetical protein [Myxococcota bacterium]
MAQGGSKKGAPKVRGPAKKKASAKAKRPKQPEVEVWQVAFDALPFYLPSSPPVRPRVLLAADKNGLIIGFDLYEHVPDNRELAETLKRLMEQPMIGPPRRPGRVVISEPGLVLALAVALDGVEIVEGETPEADEALDSMSLAMMNGPADADEDDGGDPTYLDRDMTADDVARMFRSAARLWRAAPWRALSDAEAIGLDIPALGIEGACLSVVGQAEEVFGFVLFESADAFTSFQETAGGFDPELGDELPEDLGPPMLSLTFDAKDVIPDSIVEEVARNGWELGDPARYPVVLWVDGDGIPMPHGKRELDVAGACADALASLFEMHRGDLEGEDVPSVSLEVLSNGHRVRIQVPHPGVDWSDG